VSQPYLGTIQSFAFNYAPKGWLQCNGQTLPINQYQALFSLLGTTYGGNGIQTFALPNLQSRTPLGYGNGFNGNYVLGENGGTENVTLTLNEMPSHNHLLQGNTTVGSTDTPTASTSLANGTNAGTPGPFNVLMYTNNAPNNHQYTGTIGNNGGSQPHANLMPYLTINFCIAMVGIFPSRN
jgi:microcystin-dependent protein